AGLKQPDNPSASVTPARNISDLFIATSFVVLKNIFQDALLLKLLRKTSFRLGFKINCFCRNTIIIIFSGSWPV
ncbi:MAG: hypothetical protein WC071_04355, partial [Victivallaceae bacterium]